LLLKKPFKRVKKNTARIGSNKYKKKILRLKKELYFDGQICKEESLSNIEIKNFKGFLNAA